MQLATHRFRLRRTPFLDSRSPSFQARLAPAKPCPLPRLYCDPMISTDATVTAVPVLSAPPVLLSPQTIALHHRDKPTKNGVSDERRSPKAATEPRARGSGDALMSCMQSRGCPCKPLKSSGHPTHPGEMISSCIIVHWSRVKDPVGRKGKNRTRLLP